MHRKHFKMKSETVKNPFYEQKTNYVVFVDGCLVLAYLALVLSNVKKSSKISYCTYLGGIASRVAKSSYQILLSRILFASSSLFYGCFYSQLFGLFCFISGIDMQVLWSHRNLKAFSLSHRRQEELVLSLVIIRLNFAHHLIRHFLGVEVLLQFS